MSDTNQELLEEIRKLRKAVEDSGRRQRYEQLKAQGKLSELPPKSFYGMPEVPEYHEWDGMSRDEQQAMINSEGRR